MQNNKLLIISYYWPPSGGSGVQRWLSFSNSLVNMGYDVTVLTAEFPDYPLTDMSLKSEIDPSIKVFSIPILEPSSLFKKNSSDNIKSSNIFQKIKLWIRANLFFPDSRMFWIKDVTKQAINYIKNNNIDCLITTAPPFSTHILGLNIKKNTKIYWLADFRDPWSDFFQFKLLPMSAYIRNKHLKFENKCLNYADSIMVVLPL